MRSLLLSQLSFSGESSICGHTCSYRHKVKHGSATLPTSAILQRMRIVGRLEKVNASSSTKSSEGKQALQHLKKLTRIVEDLIEAHEPAKN
eukprot:4894258-Amphidinium_carterae.1